MPPIQILDASTIAQIAAGEVIERPVSVVKELVENALDAGATRITVALSDGGRSAVSVQDDGGGIGSAELALALTPHATSKLSSPSDLFAVKTLGFRGEGLPSIAAAGRVEIVSRTRGAEFGTRIEAHGTSIGEPSLTASPPGTTVTVRDLFFATPARREFLKTPQAEYARISEFLSHVSLGWPAVHFTLRHDGRDVWSLPSVARIIDRLEIVFGKGARGTLLAVDPEDSAQRERVSGYVSRPGEDRPHRNHQVFLVNGRLVRSAQLSAAWLAAHGSAGMTGRYPYGVLSVDIPPQDVDVNVHPSKVEVRFAHGKAVFESVRRAVTRTLRRQSLQGIPAHALAREDATNDCASSSQAALDLPAEDAPDPIPGISLLQAVPSDMRVLGQIDQTYIAIKDAEQLVLIDQHAAHERIAFEAIVAGMAQGSVPRADLLFPIVVELTPSRETVLQEHREAFRQAGVDIEAFGVGVYRVCSLPAGYEHRAFDLASVLDDLEADSAPREGLAHRNRVLATIACHSVVRAHEPLSLEEQSALYVRLLLCKDLHSCPHGRPTMLRFDANSLAKAFRRV